MNQYLKEAELEGLIIVKTNPNIFPPDRFEKDKRIPIKFVEGNTIGRPRRSPYSGTIITEYDRLKFNQENTKNFVEDGIYYFICFCSPDIKRLQNVSGFNHVEKHIAISKSAYKIEKRFKDAMQEMLWE